MTPPGTGDQSNLKDHDRGTRPTPRKHSNRFRAFESLSVPQYRRYTLSFLLSSFSLQAQMVVRAWLAFDLTGSPFALSIVLATNGLSRMLVTPLGGVLADKFDRKLQIIGGQLIAASSAATLGVLILTNSLEVWHLMIGAAIHGGVISILGPARQSFVYNLVGQQHVVNAVAINAGLQNTMRLAAPAAGGLLIGIAGAEAVYFIIVAGFLASVSILALFVGSGNAAQAPTQRPSPIADFVEGWRYLRHRSSLLWLVVTALTGTGLGLIFRDMLPAFSSDALGLGSGGFGLLFSMTGLGAVAGSLIMAFYLSGEHRLGRMAFIMGILWGLLMVLLALVSNLGTAVLLMILLGGVSNTFNTLINVLIQTNVEDAFRGRILSFYMLTFTVHTFGALAIGAVAEEVGIKTAYLLTGIALTTLMTLIAAGRPDIRRMT